MQLYNIQDYLDRSGDDEVASGNIASHPTNGWCIWHVLKDKFVLIQVYGNGEFWDNWAERMAKTKQCKSIVFATKRSPKAFVRKYKYKVIGHILEREL